jgi:hypothetical protein
LLIDKPPYVTSSSCAISIHAPFAKNNIQATDGSKRRFRFAAISEEGGIDTLDVDSTILDRLGGVGDLDQLARGGVGVRKGARTDEPHAAA